MSLLVHMLPYVSDILKTNLPWKLLPKTLQAIWQHILTSRHLLASPSLQPSPSSAAADNSSRISRVLLSVNSGPRQGKVQGIPNFGQTCFMNSVLQSLASLESMLVYLDRIVRIHHDQAAVTPLMRSSSNKVPFAQELLNLLLMINGIQADRVANHHNQFKVDPRGLLKRIGETHKVFEQSGEQQDAQEYLQALFGVLITDAHLDSATTASLYMHFADFVPQEELLTTVVAGFEASRSPQEFLTVIDDDGGPSDASNPLSLSELLQRVGESQNSFHISCGNAKPVTKRLDSLEPPLTGGPEEKKQEDFDIMLTTDSKAYYPESLGNATSSVHTSPTSKTSWESMSMALKFVEGSISSSTPSPLSGWMGSTIQCCRCQHVHPIRNSPFLDIPLVPASVTAFLGTTQKKTPPPNHSNLQPCSIEQCLVEFTSVERVQDVECRNCTLQAAIMDMQEEEMVICGALESTERRVKAKGGDLSTETKSLREELSKTRLLLLKLQTMDPDAEDENSLDLETSENELLVGNEKPGHLSSLVRCTARKCLFLTRCPAILCCHIQRRYYDPYRDRMEKCTQKVLFDEYLNLAPYCTYSAEASSSWVTGTGRHSQTGDGRLQKILYQLVSIIEHRGNAFGGHYICYRRFGSTWFRVSDNNVSPVPWTYVRACEAYMLFYEAL